MLERKTFPFFFVGIKNCLFFVLFFLFVLYSLHFFTHGRIEQKFSSSPVNSPSWFYLMVNKEPSSVFLYFIFTHTLMCENEMKRRTKNKIKNLDDCSSFAVNLISLSLSDE